MKRLAAVGSIKLSYYIKNRVAPEVFERYSHIVSPTVNEERLDPTLSLPDFLFSEDSPAARGYQYLFSLCEGNDIALTAIELYLLCATDRRTLTLLQEVFGTKGAVLTMDMVGCISRPDEETIDHIPALRHAYWLVSTLLQADPQGDPISSPLSIDSRLGAYLSGDYAIDSALSPYVNLYPPVNPPPTAVLTSQRADELLPKLLEHQFSLVHISGDVSSGRTFFAHQMASRLNRGLLVVSFPALCKGDQLDANLWQKLLRELMLSDRLLCLQNFGLKEQATQESFRQLLRRIERDLVACGSPVFFTTNNKVKLTPFSDYVVFPVDIPTPTILQSETLWKLFAEQYLDTPHALPSRELASKMTLTAGQIERVMRLLSAQAPQPPWTSNMIFRLCYQVLDDGRYENIQLVTSTYTMEDLQVSDQHREVLQAICNQVAHQGIVLDQWGLRKKFPYGRCVSALFSGPPGTGKTMSAQVLSSTLGLDLYTVDLSQVTDKYIGETEKRLKQVFDQAEKSNMILFFDEADALLGKRTEVKDSKDKHANTEVAYLLQRMEAYQGIVIMATNQVRNIDSAFSRRFRYHLQFELPTEQLRRRLWEGLLSTIPCKNIDYDYLAKTFPLSGAQIKNIVLAAAYESAEKGSLGMQQLIFAIFSEQKKEGKLMLSGDFGSYGLMLHDKITATMSQASTYD